MSNLDPNITGYGWLAKLPDGELREFVTDTEALEAVRNEEEGKED